MNTGVWKRSARSKAVTASVKHSSGFAREQQDVLGVAVRGVGAGEDVALLRARRHAGRRAGALHVDDHRRDLGVVGQADQLAHQRDAGARRRGERARAVPATRRSPCRSRPARPRPAGCSSCSCRSPDPCGTSSQKLLEGVHHRRRRRDRVPGGHRRAGVDAAERGRRCCRRSGCCRRSRPSSRGGSAAGSRSAPSRSRSRARMRLVVRVQQRLLLARTSPRAARR